MLLSVCVCVFFDIRGVTGSVPYSTLQLLSLRATDNDTLVKKFQFKGKPILGIHSNQRVIVVVFKKRVLVMDAKSLGMKFHIRSETTHTLTCYMTYCMVYIILTYTHYR